jgi:hypothetical protein
MLRDAWTSAIAVDAKTFNNCLGFERGMWQHQTRWFADVPQRSVFEQHLNVGGATRLTIFSKFKRWLQSLHTLLQRS